MNAHYDPGTKRTQLLLRGLENSRLCLMYHDRDLAVILIDNTPASWPCAGEVIRRGDAAIFDRATAEMVVAAKRRVLATGEAARIEAPLRRPDKPPVWFDIHIEPDGDAGGAVWGLFVSAADITETRHREEALRALLYEVSHRSRNLLAIFQSILGQTVRHSGSIDAFERKFRGRVLSLAHSQDLITQSGWEGVRFCDLFDRQVAGFVRAGAPEPRLAGANPVLNPNEALHIGLALHELAANSASSGALAERAGGIAVEAEHTPRGRSLTWSEELAAEREVPARSGFGRVVLERVVPHAVAGRARFRVAPRSIGYRIDWPHAAADRGIAGRLSTLLGRIDWQRAGAIHRSTAVS